MTHTPSDETSNFPTKEELIDFIRNSKVPLNKRDIAKAFDIKGQDRTTLRVLLRELTEEGALSKNPTKSYASPESLPETMLIEVIGIDADGELTAKPVDWHGTGDAPTIFVFSKAQELRKGERVLAKLKKTGHNEYEAKVMKALDGDPMKVIGVYKSYKGGGYVYPANKKIKEDFFVPAEYNIGAEDGDLVLAEQMPASRNAPKSQNPVKILEVLGKKDDPRLISLISIHSHGIPTEFSAEVLADADQFSEPDLSGGREDLRAIPLVTIDGADARDFDDAVFAEPDTDPKNPGGWHLIVAIADVSFYVRPHAPLDKSAYERGNSTYFADRVVPMLPERLSNDLCSLRPHVNRACLAAHLWIDKDAHMIKWRFTRGLMRSAARLTYEQAQAAQDGAPDDTTGPLVEGIIKPLYDAYALLKRAREIRGALELDLPERKAIIDAEGNITAIVPRVRLASHQLIEEFMILANVAAAEALEEKHAPCVYRCHDKPAFDRLEATREFLKEFGYSLPKADDLQPKNLNHILKLSAEREDKALIHTVLLRTQSQAVYSPDNIGHFGLALEKYAHFTSPIRRYADLLVHRSLVRTYKLGEGGLSDHEMEALTEIATHISTTERRSMLAERDVMDRFTAQYLSMNLDKTFKGRISSVTHFGLFVSLDETGADGIVPMSYLPRDFYVHDEKRHALVGKNTGRTFRLMEPVVVRIVEADSLRGSTVFEIITGESEPAPSRDEKYRREQKERHDGPNRNPKPARGGGRDKGKHRKGGKKDRNRKEW